MIAERLASVQRRVDAVERVWTHPVEIVAVTKSFEPSIIPLAVTAGCRSIGENYAQELLTKRGVLEDLDPSVRPRVDFIGQLQSNKVRAMVGLVDRWATVDRVSLVREIAKRDPGAEVLVQVNATGEQKKGGCAPSEVGPLIDAATESGLRASGLLTVGPTDQTRQATRAAFVTVRQMVDDFGLDVCSMGMSGDFEVAIACGATSIRLGSVLFGERSTQPVHQQSGQPG